MQQLDVKLSELKQWKEHAVAPKRAELIEEMTALIGSSEEPQALAQRIKQLQEEWKTISKGIGSDSEEDWQRFHHASEAAYQPCREHFEAQAKLRQRNLEERKSVLERLRAFESRPERRASGLAGGGGRIARSPPGMAPAFPGGSRGEPRRTRGIRRLARPAASTARCVARTKRGGKAIPHPACAAFARQRRQP